MRERAAGHGETRTERGVAAGQVRREADERRGDETEPEPAAGRSGVRFQSAAVRPTTYTHRRFEIKARRDYRGERSNERVMRRARLKG